MWGVAAVTRACSSSFRPCPVLAEMVIVAPVISEVSWGEVRSDLLITVIIVGVAWGSLE